MEVREMEMYCECHGDEVVFKPTLLWSDRNRLVIRVSRPGYTKMILRIEFAEAASEVYGLSKESSYAAS